jgi:hypothetical protein
MSDAETEIRLKVNNHLQRTILGLVYVPTLSKPLCPHLPPQAVATMSLASHRLPPKHNDDLHAPIRLFHLFLTTTTRTCLIEHSLLSPKQVPEALSAGPFIETLRARATCIRALRQTRPRRGTKTDLLCLYLAHGTARVIFCLALRLDLTQTQVVERDRGLICIYRNAMRCSPIHLHLQGLGQSPPLQVIRSGLLRHFPLCPPSSTLFYLRSIPSPPRLGDPQGHAVRQISRI